jgi:hypothetical protein
VQRRMGRDAEKVSAAEGRARAREELRRRRVQAKELRSGPATAEAVVRMPDVEPDVTAEIPVVEDLDTQVILPGAETPAIHDEIQLDEPAVEELPADEPVDESVVEDVDEDVVDEEPAPDDLDAEATEDSAEADAAEVEDELVEATIEDTDPVVDEVEPEVLVESELDEPESVSTAPVLEEMPAPVVAKPAVEKPAPKWSREPDEESGDKRSLGPIAGIVGLVALAISVLLAVSALTVALGVDSGGVYGALKAMANTLVGPLNHAFDYSGSNAERKEHFLAWGAGSLGYLVLSFIGQAVQRAKSDD